MASRMGVWNESGKWRFSSVTTAVFDELRISPQQLIHCCQKPPAQW